MGFDLERGQFGAYTVNQDTLAKGGVGSIHRTDDPRFVFKRYFNPAKAPSLAQLDPLVKVGREVLVTRGKRPGDTPESSVNWPVDYVLDRSGAVSAVVLPAIPGELFNADLGNVRTLDFLIMSRARPPQAKERMALLLRMAEILAFVDAQQLVHGDLNAKNLAWTLTPEPIMYLIDCDGMVLRDPPPQVGVAAAGWTDPRVVTRAIKAHDHYSDRYCLALAMYRGLLLTPGRLDRAADGTWPEPGNIPAQLDKEVAALIRRGLSPLDPGVRPQPKEWVDALLRAYVPGGNFDLKALRAIDAITKPKSKPTPFVPLPKTTWDPAPPTPPVRQPPPQPAPRPPQPTPTQPQPWSPPPVTPRPWSPAPPPSPYQRPVATGPYYGQYEVVSGPTGGVARRALAGGVAWYLKGVLAVLLASPVALVYCVIGLLQLMRVDSRYPGVTRARISLGVYGGFAALFVLSYLSTV
ncbi:phosphotransferase [Kribbella sp. NPDC051718]|uniref:phosphotransferase n=1 Tax=Kribbella sp. NPDC051718 TaxID=3155168 RepID=UPI003443240B